MLASKIILVFELLFGISMPFDRYESLLRVAFNDVNRYLGSVFGIKVVWLYRHRIELLGPLAALVCLHPMVLVKVVVISTPTSS